MSLNATQGEKKQRPIAPIGAHVGVCFSIIDMGTHLKTFTNKEPKPTPVVNIGWELVGLPHQTFSEERGPQPLAVFQEYTTSLNEKSKLYQVLLSWRGQAPVDLAKELPLFLGQACLVNVVHNSDKFVPTIKYANVAGNGTSIMRLPQGMQVGKLTNEKIFFNLDNYSHEAFLKLPTWIQKKIQTSLEWSSIVAKHGQPPAPQTTQNTQTQNNQFNQPQTTQPSFGGEIVQGNPFTQPPF